MTKRELRERLYDYIKIELKINDGYEDKSYYRGLMKVSMFAFMSGIITNDMHMKIKKELFKRKYGDKRTLEITMNNIKDILKIK